MVRIIIDGAEIEVEEGRPLIKVLREKGIYVPAVCYNERLGPIKTCDTCVVEVNGKLARACSTLTKDGMVIRINEERVLKAREEAMNKLLENHLLYCTICDNNYDCELHEAVVKTGIRAQKFRPKGYEVDDSNPFYIYDPDQCILCGRCVEACQDVVVNEVIRIDWNLNPPRVVWSNGKRIDESSCVSCGTCVTVCPVNALMEKTLLGKGGLFTGIPLEKKKKLAYQLLEKEKDFSALLRLSDIESYLRKALIKRTKTVCPYCGVGCSYEVWTRGREILKIEPKPESPANGIATCIKGKFGWGFVNSPDRLKKPSIRDENGEFREVSWDEAILFIAKKLREIREKYGPDSIGVIASCTSTNEEAYLVQKFARQVIGTNNVDNCARYCQAPATVGLIRTVGYGADSGSFRDIESADLVIIIGSNTSEAHPVLAGKIKREKKLRGQKLIVIDAKKTDIAQWADIFVSPKVGTDLVLLKGIEKYILDNGWEDNEFIQKRTNNFEEFKKSLEGYDLEYVEKVTGVSKEEIIKIAKMIHESKRVVALWGMGVTQHQSGSETSTEICNLLLLTGNFGRPGTGGYPLRGHANVQGVSDFGALPSYLPGYYPMSNKEVRKKFEKAWNCKISDKPGLTSTEMVEEALKGNLKAMIIFGEDKVHADADSEKVKEALKKLELLVVVELFMTDTAKLAHVVLPTAASIEKEGTYVNTERRIQRLYKAFDPPGEAKSDFEIIQMLARAMGYNWYYTSPEDVIKEVRELVPEFEGLDYSLLEGFNSVQWPVLKGGKGTETLYLDRFNKPDGRAVFWPTKFIPPVDTNEQYDVILINGRMLEHFHWTNMTAKTQGIVYKLPKAYVEVSKDVAEKYGLKTGDKVMVYSRNGERIKADVMVSERLSGMRAFLAIHDNKETTVNTLTVQLLDPTSKTPDYKELPVRFEKIESCVTCEPPLPRWNPRNAERTPQIGVKAEERWRKLGTVVEVD
ncbi:MAG: formate dehydrogenase subunit alpha [Sulfolobaceae archaeon]|nr:formate dehydrogenase subunit alpha [Sulfolobaceae archaeon]